MRLFLLEEKFLVLVTLRHYLICSVASIYIQEYTAVNAIYITISPGIKHGRVAFLFTYLTFTFKSSAV